MALAATPALTPGTATPSPEVESTPAIPISDRATPLQAGAPFGEDASLPVVPRCQLTWPLPYLVTPLSWVDHHYPTRQMDDIVIRYDGATNVNYDGHRGLDLPVPANTPAMAADDGTVVYAGWDDAGGNGIGILHDGCRTFYFHLTALLVTQGQRVQRGQVIGLSGSTGNSTGPHLHFEVRDLLHRYHSVDPYGWTGTGPDPWTWDEGVLWRSGKPAVVAPINPPAAAPGQVAGPRPATTDLASAAAPPRRPHQVSLPGTPAADTIDEIPLGPLAGWSITSAAVQTPSSTGSHANALTLPNQGPLLRIQDCSGAACVIDLRGDVFRVAVARAPQLLFTLPLNTRAADLACFGAAGGGCIVIDTAGEFYGLPTEPHGPAPQLAGLPGVWPLSAPPAALVLAPGSPPDMPVGWMVDGSGDTYRFGPSIMDDPDPVDMLGRFAYPG